MATPTQPDQNATINAILSIIKDRRVNVDVSPDNIVYDIVSAIVIGGIFPLESSLYLAFVNSFLDDIEERIKNGTMDSRQLDLIGSMFGVPRQGSTFATGHVLFILGTIPTSNITVDIGTVVSTGGVGPQTTSFRYITTEKVTLDVANISSFFVQELSAYAISVLVQAEQPGSAYNKTTGAIQQIVSTVAGIVDVTNLEDISGGRDVETDVGYALRIQQTAFKPTGLTQPAGITQLLLSQNGVTNVTVVRAGDPLIHRQIGFGVVDVYVRDQLAVDVQDTNVYDGNPIVFLKNQPAISVSTIATASGNVLVSPNDFFLQPDTTGVYRNSSRAADNIRFIIAPSVGEQYTLNYTFDNNPTQLTALLNSDNNRVIGRDLLVYHGVEVPMFVSASVLRFPNITVQQVVNDIQVALINYVENNDLMGESILQANIISTITAVPSVQNVIVSSVVIRKLADVSVVTEDINVATNEYVTIDSTNIVISVLN